MALGTPTLAPGTAVVTGTAAAPTSASFTPPANSLIVVVGAVTGTATAQGAISVSSTHTGIGAWNTTSVHTSVATTVSGVMAWSLAGASPSAGIVTVTYSAGGTDNRFAVFCITGVDTTTPVVGTVSNNNTTATSLSLTVSQSPTVDDMLLGMFDSRNVTSDATVGSGFTAALNSWKSPIPTSGLLLEYKTGVTTTTVDASNLGVPQHGGVAYVVKAAVAAAPPARPATIVNRAALVRASRW